jgi:sugar phosphate isomerase/epimerase
MNRRTFLQSTLAVAGVTGPGLALRVVDAAQPATSSTFTPRLDLYGRHLLWLRDPAAVAAAVREAGYDGLDINIRPGVQGHVAPERVREDLPPFVRAVRAGGVEVSSITPPIQDADSPHAEAILATAASLGIRHYWWGTWRYTPTQPVADQLEALRPRVARLAALNERYGMTAMYHTYAGNAVGTPIWDLLSLLKEHDPRRVGFHFDVGHMVREGANGLWALNLKAAGRYVTGVSFKDFVWRQAADGRWRTEWCPLGEGLVRLDECAALLKEIGFRGPIENQPEYPAGMGGQATLTLPRDQVMAAFRKDQQVLRAALVKAGVL